MPVVSKALSGVALKFKDHFPLKFITSPPSGTGVNYKRKTMLLKDRFNNLLGEFETEVQAQQRADEIQANPALIEEIIAANNE